MITWLHTITAENVDPKRSSLNVVYRDEPIQKVYHELFDEAVKRYNAKQKSKDKLTKQLKECRDYDEKIGHLALSRIALDLDDGVKVNYRKLQTAADGKFYEVLADSKNIVAKEKK